MPYGQHQGNKEEVESIYNDFKCNFMHVPEINTKYNVIFNILDYEKSLYNIFCKNMK